MSELITFSIGYEGRTVDQLIRALRVHDVPALVDVRLRPLSRKPGFSKGVLAKALNAAEIDYEHVPSAGNPFKDGEHDVALRAYREHVAAHPEIITVLAGTLRRLGGGALMCFEREVTTCHRSVLLEHLAARGFRVTHL